MTNKRPIIDTHFHVWDSDKLRLEWLDDFESSLKKYYTLDDYLEAIKGTNIIASCYEEVDVIKEQVEKESQMAVSLCEDLNNQVKAVTLGCDLSSHSFKDFINFYANKSCVRSVRHNFFAADPSIAANPLFVENTRHLATKGLMCDLVMPLEKMAIGLALAKTCPETTFVINHCAMCPFKTDAMTKERWTKGVSEYAALPNTICKISESGFMSRDHRWAITDVVDIISHCVNSFGEDRVIYGSNWPVCEITGSVQLWIEAIQESLKDKPSILLEKLFFRNAASLYQIS